MQIRADAEAVKLSAEAMARLCEVCKDSSLRYTIQLLTPAKILAKIGGRDTVEVRLWEQQDVSKQMKISKQIPIGSGNYEKMYIFLLIKIFLYFNGLKLLAPR